jgi:hypothetical protein
LHLRSPSKDLESQLLHTLRIERQLDIWRISDFNPSGWCRSSGSNWPRAAPPVAVQFALTLPPALKAIEYFRLSSGRSVVPPPSNAAVSSHGDPG